MLTSVRRLAARSDSLLPLFTLTLIAVALSVFIAVLPPLTAVATLLIVAWLTLATVEPLFAIAFAIILGPTKALYAASFPTNWIDLGQVGFALTVGAWLLRGLAKRQIRIPHLAILIPFCLYLFTITLSITTHQVKSPNASFNEWLKWIEVVIIAMIVVDSIGREKLNWLVTIVLFSGVAQAALGIWQWGLRGTGPKAFKIFEDYYRAYGTFEQPNPFAGYLGMLWPVAIAVGIGLIFHKPQRKNVVVGLIAIAAGAGIAWGMYLSFSRGALLGAVAAAGMMLLFVPRRRWIGFGLAAIGAVAFFLLYSFNLLPSAIASRFADVGSFVQVYDVRGVHINDSNFAIVERLAHWQAAISMAEANPVLGVGVGNYEAAYEEYRLVKWNDALGHAHNIYLNTLAETGALGLAGYVILWGSVFLLTMQTIANTTGIERALAIGLIGTWTHLTVHQFLDNLYVNNIALLVGVLFGILCILLNKNQHSNQTSNL